MPFNTKLSPCITPHSTLVSIVISYVYRFKLVKSFATFSSGNIEITVDMLTEIDQLVQLIESPVFACNLPNVHLMINLIFVKL